ncbi:EcsC family protein [Microcoleus sp. FACHB-672]|uniref:EcsC family protein n=1 Tax=Microcoleus sp. FACHB-672 TaxID=2692825 RepID=UPI0016856FD4|nr:EcsC family protein [Microcoleus sp. FACHB-672]MBD2039718.1 EcsC family protein [Microcoleus sp. FACHB-672]
MPSGLTELFLSCKSYPLATAKSNYVNQNMDISVLQEALESLINMMISSDPEEINKYLNKIRSENPTLSKRAIAEKIIDEQSINSGVLGAVAGLGGLITLPATIPINIVKFWRIQAFTIRCIAYLYEYTPANTDIKTDIFLVLSNGSIEELKMLVIAEALKSAPKHALKSLERSAKESIIKVTTERSTKYAAKTITKYGSKTIVKSTMKGMSKHLTKALWKVGGRKVVEKSVQKTLGKAVPVVGAIVGGSLDWLSTQAMGKLAIEYYENSVPEWIDEVFSLCVEENRG